MTQSAHAAIEFVSQFVEQLQACATPREMYAVAGQICAEIFAPFSGSISILHPSREAFETETRWGGTVGIGTFGPAACLALRSVRPSVSRQTGPRCAHLAGSDAWGCLCVPMASDGQTAGVIHLSSSDAGIGRSGDDELEDGPLRHLATIVAAQLSMALANLGLRDSLRQMAIRDPLTGLFNRRYMEETLDRELNRAARSSSEVAIVMIDVDHFKAFNDAHGHEAGDAVLAAVGEVLRRYSRTSDVACRFGGQEFLMILPDCSLAYARLRARRAPTPGIGPLPLQPGHRTTGIHHLLRGGRFPDARPQTRGPRLHGGHRPVHRQEERTRPGRPRPAR